MNKGLLTSNTSEWATPQKLFDELNAVYHFTLDAASTDENAKCKYHFTAEQDGLSKNWGGKAFFAILHTADGSGHGCAKDLKKRTNQIRLLSCCCRHGLTHNGFTNTACAGK